MALATTAAVLVLGVLYGIAVAVALSILDLLRRVARPHDGVLGYVPGLAGMHDVDDYPPAARCRAAGLPLRLAAVLRQCRGLQAARAGRRSRPRTPVEWFVLNAEANIEVDITAVDALEELRRTLAERGIVFAMARVKQELREILASTAASSTGSVRSRVFMTLPTAVKAYQEWYAARHGGDPPSPRA